MAKREMSTTLKNLKFMQRAVKKEEKPKEDEPKPDGNFVSPSNVKRKCVVIMEGDLHPGTIKGRISFLNFNPSIDKLNNEVENGYQAEASTSCSFQSGSDRGNGVPERTGTDVDNSEGKNKRKHKQPEGDAQTSHVKKQKTPGENRNSHKQPKHGKLNWNVLVPSESQSKKTKN